MLNYLEKYPAFKKALPDGMEDSFEQQEGFVALAKDKKYLSETVACTYMPSMNELLSVYEKDAEAMNALSEGERAAKHALRSREFTRFSVGGIVLPSAFMYEVQRKWYQNALAEISENSRAKMANILEVKDELQPGDFRELDKELTKKTRKGFDETFVQVDWFYEQAGPSTMKNLSPILSHVGLQLLDESYDQQTLTPEGLILSDGLVAAETIFKCATPEEQSGFITRRNIANMMKRYARKMLYYSREGVTRPEDALGMTMRQAEIMYGMYKQFGDPLDETKFEVSID